MHTMYPGQEDNFVVMSAGAGNLDKMIDQVTEVLRRRRNVPSINRIVFRSIQPVELLKVLAGF